MKQFKTILQRWVRLAGALFAALLLLHALAFGDSYQNRQTGVWSNKTTWMTTTNLTGTIAVSTASTTVTGTGTAFLTEYQVGDLVVRTSNLTVLGTVASIASNTSLTLTANATATATGLAHRRGRVPTSADDVTITGESQTVTLDGNYSVASIAISHTGGNSTTTTLDVSTYTLTISGNTSVTGGSGNRFSKILVGGGTMTVGGNLSISDGNATFDLSAGSNSVLNIAGTMTNAGIFTPGTSSTVNFNGTSTQTLPVTGFTYAHVSLNNTAGVTLGGAITATNVTGNIRVLTGSFTNNGNAIAGNAAKTFEVANGATFFVAGTSAFPTNFTVSLGTTSTVEYSGTTQTVSQQTYGHLTLSGSGTKSTTATISVLGTLLHSSSGTFSLGAAITQVNQVNIASGTLQDNGNTITVSGTGASTWVRSGTFTATGTTIFTGAAPQIGTSNFSTLQVNVGSGNTTTATGALSVTNLVLTTGIFDPGTFSHTIATNFTLASGTRLLVKQSTFAGNYSKTPTTVSDGSTVEYQATGSTVANFIYSNLTISGTVTGASTATVDGVFTVSGSFNPGGGVMTFTDGASIVNSGTLTFAGITIDNAAVVTSSSSFTIQGALTISAGANFSPTGTITVDGGSISNSSGTLIFQSLTLSGSVTANATYSVNSAFVVNGTVNATSGTVTLGTATFTISSGSISFQSLTISGVVTANVSYEVKGTLSIGGAGNLSPTSGTVTVNGGTITNAGTLSFQNLTTSGTVTMNTSFTVKGTFSNTGTVNQTSNVLTTQSGATISNSNSLTLNSLTVAGATTGSGSFTMNGTLTLSANLAMGANTLTMGGSATTTGSADVTGTIRRTSFALSTAYTFGNSFTTMTFTSASVLPSSIDVTVSIGSAPAAKSDALQRYYGITESGGSGYSSTLRLHYLTGELNGNTATTLNLWRNPSGTYSNEGRSDFNTSDKWVQRNNVSVLTSEWTLADKPTIDFVAGNSGDWNSPSTWGESGTPVEGVNYPGPVDNVRIGNNFTVTLTANHSALSVTVEGDNGTNGTTLLDVGSFTLNVGSGGLTITGGNDDSRIARVRLAAGTLSVTGSITLNTSSAPRSVLDISSGASTVNVGGSFSKTTAGTFSAGASSIVNFNGSSPQTIDVANLAFASVRVNNTAGATLNANVTTSNISGNLLVLTGTLNNGGYSIVGDAIKTFEVANGATFGLTGTSSFPIGFGTVTIGSSSTIRYEGTNQTIAQQSYGNLVVDGSGTKTVSTALTVAGTLTHLASTTTLSGTGGDDLTAGKVVLTGGTLNDNGRTINVTGTGSGVWDKNGAATFTASGTTVFTGAAPQISSSNFSTFQINVGSGNTATATGALSIANFTLTSGRFDPGSFAHTISTNLTLNTGSVLLVKTATYAGNYSRTPDVVSTGSTVEYTATGSTVANIAYSNLTISGTVTGSSTASVDGTFTVSNSFTPSGGTLTMNDGASIVNSGTLTFSGLSIAAGATVSSSSAFTVGGALSVGSGATYAPTGTITLNAAALTNAGSLTFQNLTLTGTVTANTSYTVNGTLAGGGDLDASSGTVTLGNGATISTSGAISFSGLTVAGSVTANATYAIKGLLSVGASGNLSPTSGTVTLANGSSVSNSGTLSFQNVTTAGTVTMNTGFSVKGTFNNTGTVNQTSGTLTTTASAVISNSSSLTLNNLTVNGATTGSGNFTVNGTLTLNANLAMGANSVTMGGASVTAGAADVTGTVRRTTFSNGTAYSFGNAFTSLNFVSASVLPTSVDVTIAIGSAPPEKSDAITRTYAIAETGGSGYAATLRLHYLDAELNGNDESSLNLWFKDGSSYVDSGSTASNNSDNWIEKSGLTSLSATWTLANFAPTGFIAAVTGNWNAPATWGLTGTPTEGVNYPGPNDIANINGDLTVTVTTNQSVRKILMQPTGTPKTATLNIDEGLTMSVGTGGITLASTLSNRNAVINAPSVTLNVDGSISLTGSSVTAALIDLTGGSGTSTLNLKGSISRTDATAGSLVFSSTGLLNMNGTGGQTLDVRGSTFGTIHLNNTSGGGAELLGDVTTSNVAGDLRVQSGTFNTGGYAVAGNSGKTFQLAAGSTFIISGTSTFPTGFTFDLSATSTVNYSGGAQAVSDQAYGNLILGGSGSKTITSSLSVTNNFTYSSSASTSLSGTSGHNLTAKTVTISAGTLNDNGRTITVTGTSTQVWTKSGGTFTTSGTVAVTGAGAQIGSSNFASLNINVGVSNTATALGALSMTSFSLTTGTFNPDSYLHTISSSFTVGNGTTLLVNTTTFGANYSSNPTTQSGSTIEYTSAGSTISNAFAYQNLTVSGTVTGASSATVNEKFTVSGTFTPSTGTMIFNNGAEIINNGTLSFRNITISDGATVVSASSFAINDALSVGQNAIFQPSGTVSFVTGGSITVSAVPANEGTLSFNNLSVSAPVTTSSSFSISGTLNIQASGEIDPTAGKITMGAGSTILNSSILSFHRVEMTGTVTANTNFAVKDSLVIGVAGTLSPTSGTITLENGAKVLNSGNLSFNNLTVNGTVAANTSFTIKTGLDVSSGADLTITSGTVTLNSGASVTNNSTLSFNHLTIASGSVTANQGFAVSGTLTLNGDLVMGSNILDLGTTATIGGTSDVTGNVRRSGTFSLSTAYAFGSQFTSVTFASGTPPTSITMNIAKGSSPVEKPEAILRYNDITTSGGGSYEAALRFRFLTGELNGNDPSTLSLWRKVGVNPYADSGRTTNNLVNNWVEKSGLTEIDGIWTLARQNPGGFIAVISGDWNDPATWGLSGAPAEGVNYPGPSDIANIINNLTVTLTAVQSAQRVNVEGPTVNGTALLEVGAYTLNIGTGGLRITGGTADTRIAKVTVAGGTIALDGDLVFTTTSAIRAELDMSLGSNSTLAITGAMTKTSAGTFTSGSSGVVNFNSATSGQTLNLSSFTFSNIRINNTGGGVTLGNNVTTSNVTGDIRVQSGALNNGGFAIEGNVGKTFEVANGASFNLTGTSTFATGFTMSLGASSSVNYVGTAQTIANQSYGNLTLGGSGGHTVNSALSASGTFTYSSSGSTSLSATVGHNLTVGKFSQSSGTFSDNGRTIFVTGSGASTWTKSGGTFTATGIARFTGVAPQIGSSNFGTLEIDVSSDNTATATGSLTPTHLVLTTGMFDPGSFLHTITTNFTLANSTTLKVVTSTFGGNYSKSPTTVSAGSTVEYTNASSTLSNAFTYSNLLISGAVTGSSSPTVGGAFTVSGTFNNPGGTVTLNDGASIVVSGGTLNFSNVSIAASATVASSSNFGVNGTLSVGSSGTFAPTNTITMLGGSTISNAGSLTFSTLSIAGAVTANTSYSVNTLLTVGGGGNLTATSGTVTMTGTSTIANSATLEFATLVISGTTSTSSNFSVVTALTIGGSGTFTASAGTVTMNGGSSISNSNALTFFNLTTGSGTVTSSSNFSVSGTFEVGTGSTFNPTGTITMNSGSTLTRSGTSSMTDVTVAGGTVTGSTNLTVSGVLTLNGTLSMGANTLLMGTSATTAGSGDVTGNVERTSFSIGTSYSFGNEHTTLTFNSATALPTSVVINIAIGSAPAEKASAILRVYGITETGGVTYSSTLRLHYLDDELNSNIEASMTVWKRISGTYQNQGKSSSDETNNWVQQASLTSLSENWTLANPPAVGFSATQSGDWNLGATWGNSGDNVEGSGYPGPTDVANIIDNFTVTLTASQSVGQLNVTGSSATNGTSLLSIGSQTMTVGTGGLAITGGSNNSRIARIDVNGGTLTVNGSITFSTGTASRAVLDLSGAGSATSTFNVAGSMTKSSAGTFTPGTASTVNFNGSGSAQTIDVTNFAYANVNVNNTHASGGTINAAVSATNITANLRVQSGAFSNGGFAIVGGTGDTFEVGAGATFKMTGTTGFPTAFSTTTVNSASTVEYIGGAQTVALLSYGNLVLGGTGSKTISGVLNVSGMLTYSSSASTTLSNAVNTSKFALSNGTLNDGGVTITVSGTGANTWSKTGGTFTTTGTIRFTGTNPEISASNFGTLDLQVGASGTAVATGIHSSTNLVLTSGTFDPGVYGHTVVTNFTLANDTRLLVRGGEFVTNYSKTPTSIGTNVTVEYVSGSAQTVNQTITYSKLKLTGSGAKSAGGALTVNDSLVINTGASLNGVSYNHQIKGAWLNNGSYTGSIGAVTLNGLSAQTIGGTSATTFNSLTISNANGITIETSPTVNGILTLTSGNVTTGANKVTLGSAGTVSRTSGHIVGNFEKHVAAGPTTRSFEIGDASNYTPVSVSFANVSVAGYLTATTTAGDHPDIANSSVEPDSTANRYWTLTNSGMSFSTYDATFTFVAGDLDPGVDPLTFVVTKLDGVTWSDPGTGSVTATTTQGTGMTSFSNFVVGTPSSADFLSIGTGDWNAAGSWDRARVPKQKDRVTIVAGHTVTLTDAREVTNLAVNGTGVFNGNGNTLSVFGNITLDGTWSGSGTIEWVAGGKTLSGTGTASGTSVLQIIGTGHSVDAAANLTLFQVNIPAGNSFTNDGTIGLTRLTGGNGASTWTQGTNSNLTVVQDLLTTGTLTATASGNTVTYGGNSAQSVKTTTYHHLVHTGTGTKSLSGAISIDGDLSVNAGTLDLGAFTANRSSAGGTLTIANGATLKIGGTGTVPSDYSTHSVGATSTIEYSGTTQSIVVLNSSQNYGTLIVSGSGTKTLAGSIGVASNLTIQGGTMDLAGFTADRTTGGGTFTLSNGAGLTIGGTNGLPASYATHSIGASSTVEYAGTNQTINIPNSSQSYGHLTLSVSGIKTFSAGTTGVQGNFVLNAGPTVDATTNSSTILLNGTSGSQALAVIDYYHLSFTNAGSKVVGSGTTRIAGDFTVSGGAVDATTNTSTIEYNGTASQSVAGITYYLLHFSNGGVKTIGAATTIDAGMLVNAGASVFVNATGVLTLGGDLENDGTLTNEGTIEVSP